MLVAALLLLVVGAVPTLSAASVKVHRVARPSVARPARAEVRVDPSVARSLRATTWRWQVVVGRPRTHSAAPLTSPRTLRFWRQRARRVLRLAAHPPHKSAWLCIHRFEGSWRDAGDPYWGGLQMDRGFMRSYAPAVLLRRGFADRWSALEQMW